MNCHLSNYLLLQIFVKEAEEGALPEDGVLRLEDPVVLIGEYEHLSFKTMHLCGVECHHALRSEDAVVKFADCNEDRGCPVVDKLMG